jgi:hypothetical protein
MSPKQSRLDCLADGDSDRREMRGFRALQVKESGSREYRGATNESFS